MARPVSARRKREAARNVELFQEARQSAFNASFAALPTGPAGEAAMVAIRAAIDALDIAIAAEKEVSA